MPRFEASICDIFCVILEYCGGTKTDRLVTALQEWNPELSIHVLDNASPVRRSRFITHRNLANSFIGGGIRDCVRIAAEAGARYVLFIANDVAPVTPIRLTKFVSALQARPDSVQISAAISRESAQAAFFPWMIAQPGDLWREVPHADLLFTLLDLPFLTTFGGFPPSVGGWGYGWEIAYHAKLQSRPVVILDDCVIHHAAAPAELRAQIRRPKAEEVAEVYQAKYGNIPWRAWEAAVRSSWAAVVSSEV